MLSILPVLQVATSTETSAEQLNNAVEQLSKSSIELAEATANYGALKVVFGVFIVFAFVMLLMFLYQSFTTTRKVSQIHSSCEQVKKMTSDTANRTLGKPQSSILIRRNFNQLSQTVKYTILRTRLENHLDQTDYVKAKVERLVQHEYQEMNSFLMNYICDEKTLATHINLEDAKIISDFVLEQVYLDDSIFTIASMDQAADIILNGLKLEALKGIE